MRYAAVAPADTATEPAIGYAIGRKVGPAVVRNRIRRRLRAILRDVAQADGLQPGYYLFGVRSSAAAAAPFDELRDDVVAVVAKARSSH